MDKIWQYSSKANSSNVHDFLLIIGTVLNLVKKNVQQHMQQQHPLPCGLRTAVSWTI